MTVTPGLPSALHVMATVVRSEPKGLSKPAIYTFLGLATLPRFRVRGDDGPRTRGARRAANPLRLLPREIVTHIARFAYRWPQRSRRSLRAIPGRRVAERCPRPSPRLSRPRGFGGHSVHTLLRHAADPTRDTGGGEPPYDCFGASRRRFVARGAQCHGPWVD